MFLPLARGEKVMFSVLPVVASGEPNGGSYNPSAVFEQVSTLNKQQSLVSSRGMIFCDRLVMDGNKRG